MFCIAVRLLGSPAPGDSDKGIDPLPWVNKPFPLIKRYGHPEQWEICDTHEAMTTFTYLEAAQEVEKLIKDGIFYKEPHVEKVIERISEFIAPYQRRNVHCQAWVEILAFQPLTISVNEIDLKRF
jgi:hypothetical protein